MRGDRIYLARRDNTIVTGITVVDAAGIVRPGAANEGRRGMTGRTVQVSRNVRRYSIHHALCRSAVMARGAIIRDAGVIESRRFEEARVVADTAILGSRNMAGFLRRGKTGTVTGRAVIHDASVTKGRRLETGSLMTVPAISVGRYMEIRFSGGSSAVVARLAGIIVTDKLVVEPGTGKSRSVMAHRAILGCRNVANVHAYCGTAPIGHVTRRTVIHDAGMIEYGRLEAAAGDVAGAAILACHEVVGIHAFRGAGSIGYMTGIAAYGQHGRIVMVDKRVGKTNRVMTQGAVGGGYRVRRARRLDPGANGSHCGEVAIVAGDAIAGDAHVGKHG